MRKKELFAQNDALFNELQKAKLKLESLNAMLSEKNKIIDSLKTELENVQNSSLNNEEESTADDNIVSFNVYEMQDELPIDLDEVTQYGAEIIGKLVVISAQYSNSLTSGGNTDYRELVNLLLGKTEVSKAEILAITVGDGTAQDKKSAIDEIFGKTQEYYLSVMAQK